MVAWGPWKWYLLWVTSDRMGWKWVWRKGCEGLRERSSGIDYREDSENWLSPVLVWPQEITGRKWFCGLAAENKEWRGVIREFWQCLWERAELGPYQEEVLPGKGGSVSGRPLVVRLQKTIMYEEKGKKGLRATLCCHQVLGCPGKTDGSWLLWKSFSEVNLKRS